MPACLLVLCVLCCVRCVCVCGSCASRLLTRRSAAVYGDTSALSPGGVRVGSPAMTTRGLTTDDFATVAEFLHRGCQIAIAVQEKHGKQLKVRIPTTMMTVCVSCVGVAC